MKKIGIVSCYFKNNYGSMLQAYATQKVLDNNNILNETINISQLSDFNKGKKKFYLSQISNFNFIKTKFGMIKLKIYSKFNRKLKQNFKIRNKKFNEFKRNFEISTPFKTYEELNKYSENHYNNVIVGSDQLWLPVNVISDYYTLNWVPNRINKISCATSFGISNIPEKYKDTYKNFLSRINKISVREKNGVELVKKLTGKDAKLLCDPTLLLTKNHWDEIVDDTPICKENYIFCYFLGKNIEHRKFVEKLKEKTGYKIISINHCDEYVKYSDKFADETPYDVGPSEFINYIKNAKYVCTDSFHGTVFSVLYNKQFYTFERFNKNSKMSTNSRIYSLLNIIGLEKRLITGKEQIDEIINKKIDYECVNDKVTKFRNDSLEWLITAIETNKEKSERHIIISNKEDCTGCAACKSICPQNAIKMEKDEEGFLYPIIDKDKCIECGLCKKICPIMNNEKSKKIEQKAYIFQNNDEKIRLESTSGGAFTAIAEEIINSGGIVYGAAFDDNYKVKHQSAETKEDIAKFRNSKYVQSEINNTFIEIKKELSKGRKVLFSGTSCQIAGLRAFLGKDYSNLFLVDVVCRAVPSPLMWEKYIDWKRKEYIKPKKVLFRDKFHGYKYSNMSIYGENKDYHQGVESDPYLRAFFSNICDRPSCYECKFKTQYRQSDLTIWDCFNVEKFSKKLDDDKGTTRILCHTQKGLGIINELKLKHICKEISVYDALADFNGIFSKVKYNPMKNEFVNDLNKLDAQELFEKYFPDSLQIKIERNLRKILLKTGLYKKIITLGKKIRKRD